MSKFKNKLDRLRGMTRMGSMPEPSSEFVVDPETGEVSEGPAASRAEETRSEVVYERVDDGGAESEADETGASTSAFLPLDPQKDVRISRLRAQMDLLRAKGPKAPRTRARFGDAARDDDAFASHDDERSRPRPVGAESDHERSRPLRDADMEVPEDPWGLPEKRPSTVDASFPGDVEETPFGALRRVLTIHEEDHRHGAVEVVRALDARAADLAVLALDPTLAEVDLSRVLFIDTETTGLAGGAGTLPFLIGSAWFEGRKLHVEQLLLEKPGHEGPMLQRLAERLREASCIVSYNGKSFDWPLLRTRFIMNRVPAPKVALHLDLLHCARRVYKPRLGQVRLVHLEEEILGFTRIDDISGELIPETYLGVLKGRLPASALTPIVDHNRSDIVALAAILGELARRFSADHEQHVLDQMGFAKVAARADDHERAAAFAERVAERDVRGDLAPQALYLSGQLALSRGDLSAAIELFLRSAEVAAFDEGRAALAHLALAKLYEHKQKDYAKALEHARKTSCAEGDEACEKRVARLERRLRVTPPDSEPTLF